MSDNTVNEKHSMNGSQKDANSESKEALDQPKTSRLNRRLIAIFIGVLLLLGIAWTASPPIIEEYYWHRVMMPKILSSDQETTQAAKAGSSFKECQNGCPEMVVIPRGQFDMGSVDGRKNEKPVHNVIIDRPFAVSKYETTVAEWNACVAAGACQATTTTSPPPPNRPVVNISWQQANQYAEWMSRITGKPYRLLSESEWEYAIRAGKTVKALQDSKRFGTRDGSCNGCGSKWDKKETAPVGSFDANSYGLHDMRGNVREMTMDCWNETYQGAPANGSVRLEGECGSRAVRGGSWRFWYTNFRLTRRGKEAINDASNDLGFRLARDLQP
ncbi:MAG: SUMF1/EgtB/PvdO family nonheme iron enzyme [Pseudomonadota bacterium]